VTAKLQIEVLAEGWHYVHLRLKDAAIRSAQIGGQPARLIFEAEKGYWVLVEKKGTAAEKIELLLEYSKAFTKQPGTNSVSFDAPQAPVNRWQIRIPEPGVKVNVHPNISTTDSGAEAMGEREDEPDRPKVDAGKETLVQAFVGAAPTVRIDWTAKAEGAAGLTALVTVQARQEIVIDEGVVRTRVNLAYDIQRADATQLTIEAPADHNVVNVFDANVQKWERKTEGPVQVLTVWLFQPARGSQNVLLELEKFAGDREMPQEMTSAEIRAPVVRALQAGTPEKMAAVGRQQGVVVVRLGAALRGEATARTGLLQIDARELPPPLAKQEWAMAYRYAAVPFDLTLSVEKVQPQVAVTELVEVYLEPNQITANLLAILDIQRAGIFQIELEVPESYDVRSVQGREAAGAAALKVESHHLEDVEYVPNAAQPDVKAKKRTKLVVQLAGRALGKAGLFVELAKQLDDPNLLTPTGASSVIGVPLPRVAPARVARITGVVAIYAPESLRITPQEPKGLRPIALAEAVKATGSMRAGRFPQLRELLAYAYSSEAASLNVQAQRRKPYVEARELLTVHIEPGVVRYEATFVFDIKYSGVRSLRLDVPAALADKLRNLTPALREERIEPQPADVAPGYVAWQLVGEGELIGEATAKFTWETQQGDLPVGQGVAIDLPQLRMIGVDRFWGQIAASKAETIEISVKEEPKGLRPIDPQRDLLAGAKIANAARAFEFHEDWSLALQATRYQLEEVKRTSIERAVVRMVVTRSDTIAVQAIYHLRSARQRIAVKLPGVDPQNSVAALDSQALRINKQPAPLEHDRAQFFIPLTGHSPEETVVVELRYTIAADVSSLQLPEFPDEPAMQQVDLFVWLPEEWKVLGVRGPWTEEKEGNAGHAPQANEVDDFPVDGRRYAFSTLRPAPGAEGALRLTVVHRNVLHAAVFLIVAIIGIVLTPQAFGRRLWWLAGLVVALVLSAVFIPAFAEAVLGPPFYFALGLVLLAWLVRFLAWFTPMLSQWFDSRAKPVATPLVTQPLADAGSGQEGGPSNA
jgi:hypothetical protein